MAKKRKAKAKTKLTGRAKRAQRSLADLSSLSVQLNRNYDPQTGKLTGRAKRAQPRLEAKTQEYIQQGMDAASARQRAIDEMRDNPRKDWRAV